MHNYNRQFLTILGLGRFVAFVFHKG